eukprot:scaffold163162_cov26-Tisochrysis_lutea.AAC.1
MSTWSGAAEEGRHKIQRREDRRWMGLDISQEKQESRSASVSGKEEEKECRRGEHACRWCGAPVAIMTYSPNAI